MNDSMVWFKNKTSNQKEVRTKKCKWLTVRTLSNHRQTEVQKEKSPSKENGIKFLIRNSQINRFQQSRTKKKNKGKSKHPSLMKAPKLRKVIKSTKPEMWREHREEKEIEEDSFCKQVKGREEARRTLWFLRRVVIPVSAIKGDYKL